MKKKILIFILVLLIIILSGVGGVYFYANSKLSKVNHKSIDKSKAALGIDDSLLKKKNIDDDYVNVLFLGIDTRDKSKDAGRSDATMIITIDKKHDEIKITSLMRDSIETMTGHGPMEGLNQDRLNHAYAYGGGQLAIKTVNQNYEMNIKDYVKVDFGGLEKIIDFAGGVDINVSKEEVPEVNGGVREVAAIEKETPKIISSPGMQHLNGIQAVSYCRIRHVGNNDFERTERQRTVLTQVFNKLAATDKSRLPEMADKILPCVETSLEKSTMYNLALYLVTNKPKAIKQLRLPIDGANHSETIRNTYFLGWDKEKNLDALHKFITEE